MPDANLPPGDALYALLQNYEQRLSALETQQLFILSSSTGTQRLRIGTQADATVGAVTFDSAGAERVRMGQLASGDYGLAITDPATSTVTEILPVYSSSVTATEATTSGTYTDLATVGPTVTATIGASGQALLTINSYMGVTGIAGSQAGGFVGVSIDGAAPTGNLDKILYYAVSAVAAVGIAGSIGQSYIVAALTPGSHTFKMQYYTASGGSVSFGKRFLQVRPL